MRIGGGFPGRGAVVAYEWEAHASRRSVSSYGVPRLSDMGRVAPRPFMQLGCDGDA